MSSPPPTPPPSPPPPTSTHSLPNALPIQLDPTQPYYLRPPLLTWQALLTGEGLPASDRPLLHQCHMAFLGSVTCGAFLTGGLSGGLVYGRRLLNRRRRFLVTALSALWGAGVGSLVGHSSCLQLIKQSPNPESVLKRELAKVVRKHNPNAEWEAQLRSLAVHDVMREIQKMDSEDAQRGVQRK